MYEDFLRKGISSLDDTDTHHTHRQKKLSYLISYNLNEYRFNSILSEHINQNVFTMEYRRRAKLQLHEKDGD